MRASRSFLLHSEARLSHDMDMWCVITSPAVPIYVPVPPAQGKAPSQRGSTSLIAGQRASDLLWISSTRYVRTSPSFLKRGVNWR